MDYEKSTEPCRKIKQYKKHKEKVGFMQKSHPQRQPLKILSVISLSTHIQMHVCKYTGYIINASYNIYKTVYKWTVPHKQLFKKLRYNWHVTLC